MAAFIMEYQQSFEPPHAAPLVLVRGESSASRWQWSDSKSDNEQGYVDHVDLPFWLPDAMVYKRVCLLRYSAVVSRQQDWTTGTCMWAGGEECARWVGARLQFESGAPFATAIELGTGTGIVALALAAVAHVHRVTATDGDENLCRLVAANAHHNGLGDCIVARRLVWGQTGMSLDECLCSAATPEGSCPELIIASEVLYDRNPETADALERTIRALLGRGGCRLLAICWRVRTCREERFLYRLADLGSVRIAWRSAGGAPPLGFDNAGGVVLEGEEAEWDRWAANNMGTFVLGLLDPCTACVSM